MNKKGISRMILLIIIVAIVVVSSIAVYLAMSGGDGSNGGTTDNGDNNAPTNGNGTPDNGSTEVSVAGASSLQFKVSFNPADSESVEYTYMVKNAETENLMMRIEMKSGSEEFIYIINGVQENVWVYSDGEWMDFSNLYPSYWETWNSAWEGYRTNLLDWTGYGDWSYSTPNGDSVRIYDITINPSLSDSLFEH
jgi:hypothetical protein